MKDKLRKQKRENAETTRVLKGIEREKTKTDKENEKLKARIAELEKINDEARAVIDEKNDEIKKIKEEIEVKTNENKRWELKLAELKKDGANDGNETTNADTTECNRDNVTPVWMEEMEKVEAELEEKTNQLKLSEKEKNLFQLEIKSKEEKLKDLLVEMNKQKTEKLTLQEEIRGLKEINKMMELDQSLAPVENGAQLTPRRTSTTHRKKDKMNQDRNDSNRRDERICRYGDRCYSQQINNNYRCSFKHQSQETDVVTSATVTTRMESQETETDDDDEVEIINNPNPMETISLEEEPSKKEPIEESDGKQENIPDNRHHEGEEKNNSKTEKPREKADCKNGVRCYYRRKGDCWYKHGEDDGEDYGKGPNVVGKNLSHKNTNEDTKTANGNNGRKDHIECRNGKSCRYQKKGRCWFHHADDNKNRGDIEAEKYQDNKKTYIDHFLMEAVAQATNTIVQQIQKTIHPERNLRSR